MISLLLPSRGRPENIGRLLASVNETADHPEEVELIVYIDDDDPRKADYISGKFYKVEAFRQVSIFVTERTVLSKYWNMAYKKAQGPIYMHCGDDIVFKTPGWDTKVKKAFDKYDDKLVFVYGDDGDPTHDSFGTHGFIHRNWVDTVGYFVPPYFSSDYNDTWLNELADGIGRKHKVDILTEHMHFALGKGTLDLTHAERLVRHHKDNTTKIYEDKADERKADIAKLKAAMQ